MNPHTSRTAVKLDNRKAEGGLYQRIRLILESARISVSRSVNTTQVAANWLIGQEIVEDEQSGSWRAEYGKKVLKELSSRLRREYGNGYSVDNLELFRRFYREYPSLNSDALRRNSATRRKSDALRRKLAGVGSPAKESDKS